eukprot:12488_1
MSNPSRLAYSNYSFGNSGYAQSNKHHQSNLKSNSSTTNNTDQDVLSNLNMSSNHNIHPLYIYSQNINHHYPPQHHHYHLFQMAQHQQLEHYSLNPYTTTVNNMSSNITTVSPYVLNPYNPHKPHQHKLQHTPHPTHPMLYGEGNKHTTPTAKENIDEMDTIVSIPDEFASAINDDFSEMIGMQDVVDQNNNKKEEEEEDKWQNEAFICQRKEQIISFLQMWDTHYPETSENGENECKEYDLPPGLHNKCNGKPLNGEGNDKSKYYLEGPSYTFNGSLEEAKRLGIRENKWIMIIIFDTDLFTAQWSNPLIWRHKRYSVLIKQNFVFFNVICNTEKALHFASLYNLGNAPCVCIIDPHSNVKRFEFVAPSTSANIIQLRKDIVHLLNTCAKPRPRVRKPPIPHKYDPEDDQKMMMSSLEISSSPHIYCSPAPISNIWDLCYPYSNLRHNAYILSTRQTFDWNDWMLIIKKSRKIIGAIPSEQHIEFLRNRNGEMTLESSGTYNGWWSEQRIAEYVVNEKFGLSFEGGFASENG